MQITGHRNRPFILAHRSKFGVNRTCGHLPSQRLLRQNRPRILVLDEGADRTATGTTRPSKFFEPSEDLRQPRFQQCVFDLSDIPVQDQKRGSTDVVDREECHGRGVVVGAGLGGCVDDREDGVASGWKGKRLVLNEELLAAEEGDARPIDELGEILLGADQRIVFPAQIFVKQRTTR
jgi:hypothetical protein